MNTVIPLRVTNLTKTFQIISRRPQIRHRRLWQKHKEKITALNCLNLSLNPGEIYGCLGPNGAGKTTTLKIILDLISPDSGSVAIFGAPATDHTSRASVGYVPEEPGFYGFLTGRDLLYVCAQLLKIPKEDTEREIERVIVETALEKESLRKIKTYSKGARQRLSIAQAMLKNPKLLLLDEPTSGLDPIGTNHLRNLLLNLKNQGAAIFLCSHLLTEVEKIADRIGILKNGTLIEEAVVDEIKAHSSLEELFMQKVGA